jgi:HEAT repeat protein
VGSFKTIIALAVAASAIYSAPIGAKPYPTHLPYLVHRGQLTTALDLYQESYRQNKQHDVECLELIALSLLEQGARSRDPEEQLMTQFGAGISMDERAMPILLQGVHSPIPGLQLIALNFLGRSHTEQAERALLSAMRSNSLLVRFEAAYQLSRLHLPGACNAVESLMSKIDGELLALFAPLYGLINDDQSMRALRKLLTAPYETVRIAAINSCAAAGRDDFIPKIETLTRQHSTAQQEACAYALGILGDEAAEPLLRKMTESHHTDLKLAALYSLYQLGRHDQLPAIYAMAADGNLFAIALLGDIPNSDEQLVQLMKERDLSIKVNVATGLVRHENPHCMPLLREILIKDQRDFAFEPLHSHGGSLSCWRAVPSARQNFKDTPTALERSLHFREQLLTDATRLPAADFLQLAAAIFDGQQNDLVPALTSQLELLATPEAIALLQKYQQQVGMPLIRNYCNLALYRLKIEGPYGNNLQAWVAQQASTGLIELRPPLPWEERDPHHYQNILPHENSRLLVETFEAFTQRQDDQGINILIEAIKSGFQKNRYALAGLLLRAAL